jgi:hypothetical protein
LNAETEDQARSGAEPTVRSSVKPSHVANDNLINHTCQVWQRRLGRDLTHEDARQIAENVTGFFAVLAEWSRADLPSPANDAGKAVSPNSGEARNGR